MRVRQFSWIRSRSCLSKSRCASSPAAMAEGPNAKRLRGPLLPTVSSTFSSMKVSFWNISKVMDLSPLMRDPDRWDLSHEDTYQPVLFTTPFGQRAGDAQVV